MYYFFHETVNSNNLETANYIAQVIFVHCRAMNTIVNQKKQSTYYPNYFIVKVLVF